VTEGIPVILHVFVCEVMLCVPVGQVNVTFEAPQFGELELLHIELSLGGSWAPLSCIARHRVAVIIPFRDRQLHLRTLLAILHPMLQRQMLQYTIFVVEQVRFLAAFVILIYFYVYLFIYSLIHIKRNIVPVVEYT